MKISDEASDISKIIVILTHSEATFFVLSHLIVLSFHYLFAKISN